MSTGKKTTGSKAAKAAKAATKTEIYDAVAERSGLKKSDVKKVLEALTETAARELKTRKVFALPDLVKITVVHKPAKPARQGRRPGTTEMMMYKAQPAKNVVKVRALKKLKDMA